MKKIAHRGLFNNLNIPENSLMAFDEAFNEDLSVELDIRLTLDKEIIVFHDKTLDRMTKIKGNVEDFTYLELSKINLLETNFKIIKLSTLLSKYFDQEFYIEIKESKNHKELIEKLSNILIDNNCYKSKVISFNPYYISYFRKINKINKVGISFQKNVFINIYFFIINIYFNSDFYLAEVSILDKIKTEKEVIAWTVKNKDDEKYTLKYTSTFIFEKY